MTKKFVRIGVDAERASVTITAFVAADFKTMHLQALLAELRRLDKDMRGYGYAGLNDDEAMNLAQQLKSIDPAKRKSLVVRFYKPAVQQ